MSETEIVNTPTPTVSKQLRSETMAYALMSGVSNLLANFFEPYIAYRTQRHYSQHDLSKKTQAGNYTQNLAGEFAGDIIGASTLIVAEAMCPEQLHSCTRAARQMIDPVYDKAARMLHAGEQGTPDYEAQIGKWKLQQERNFVRSAIIGTAGIAGNIATQKLVIGNPSPTGVIFKGKLLSTALTTAMGLGVRIALPQQTRDMDKWLGKTVFAPMLQQNDNTSGHMQAIINEKETQPAGLER